MSVEAQKLEIIEWVLKLKDVSAIKEVMKVKNVHRSKKRGTRKFGSGKNIFTYVADDFDAPLPDFKGYMK
jgi:hypothetical protein